MPTLHHPRRRPCLADNLLTAIPPAPATMPEMLRTQAHRPDRATTAAIYFHAIALVNNGWTPK